MAYLLVAATDGKQLKRGEVLLAKDTPVFGKQERLPDWIRLEVTGATAAEVEQFQRQWLTSIRSTIQADNAQGWRVRLELDPVLVAATGINGAFKQELKAFILGPHENWSATQVNQSPTHLTVDIPKGGATLVQIRAELDSWFIDRLQVQSGFRQYHFNGTDVDWGVAQGTVAEQNAADPETGDVPPSLMHHSMTKQEVLTRIVNRLEV